MSRTSSGRLPARRTRRSAGTPRWRFEPPVQERARDSVERFARAAETLLREKPFEAIGVQELARLAGKTTGAFYARFSSKDGLLPYLYDRYDRNLESLVRRRLGGVDWAALPFERAVSTLVGVLIGLYAERRWFLRAMALFVRRFPEALPADLEERRRRVMELEAEALRPHRARIAHEDPDAAIRFGVFMISAVAREKLLFGDAPHARVTSVTSAQLEQELSRALLGYLTAGVPLATSGRTNRPIEGG